MCRNTAIQNIVLIVSPDSGNTELNLMYNIPCELFTTLCIYCFKPITMYLIRLHQTLHVSDTVKTI